MLACSVPSNNAEATLECSWIQGNFKMKGVPCLLPVTLAVHLTDATRWDVFCIDAVGKNLLALRYAFLLTLP